VAPFDPQAKTHSERKFRGMRKATEDRAQASKKLAKLLAADRSDHVSTVELRENSAAVVSRAALGERLVVTRNKKPIAAIVPIADLQSLEKTSRRGPTERRKLS